MRIAVVSDIHANLQAWNAVWLDIRSMAVDRVVSLGDAIGYGPNPAEVLEALYTSGTISCSATTTPPFAARWIQRCSAIRPAS